MQVTKLARGIRNPEKVALYIDSKYTFSVLDTILSSEDIYVGKRVTDIDLEKLQSLNQKQEIKNKVLALIARRPRSEFEVKTYLRNRLTEEETLELITNLKESNYINDTEFTKWWIEQRRTFTTKSTNFIKQELIKKRIDKNIIEDSLEEEDPEIDINKAKKLLEKKIKVLSSKNLNKQELNKKLISYLQNRGFNWETIKQVINN